MKALSLNAVSVGGYKGLSNLSTLEISSLTLVFGENSAGKSSLVRLLVSIARAIKTKSNYPLLPVEPSEAGGSFKDLLTGGQGSIAIDLYFGTEEKPRILCFSYALAYIPEDNSAPVIEFKVIDQTDGAAWIFRRNLDAESANRYESVIDSMTKSATIGFEGLAPVFEASEKFDSLPRFENLICRGYTALQQFANSVRWIGPLRSVPARNTRFTTIPTEISNDGREVAQLVHPNNPGGNEAAKLVSEWYTQATKRIFLVAPAVVHNKDVFDVSLSAFGGASDGVPISEHGAGMAQVFPIVVLSAWASLHANEAQPLLLIFENPELHLHDAIHEHLAALFLLGINGGARILAETHSENLLLATQLEVISRPSHAGKVAITWVQRSEASLAVTSNFNFDKEGSLGGLWSKSIFGNTTDLARKIIDAKLSSAKSRS